MKWVQDLAGRIYEEGDFARSLATSVGGAVALAVYLACDDPVIAIFSAVIAFPVAKLAAGSLHRKATAGATRQAREAEADHLYGQLTEEERGVISAFVGGGGCVMTWGEVNRSTAPSSGVESLSQRGLLHASVALDGMRETFTLDVVIFDAGVRASRRTAF